MAGSSVVTPPAPEPVSTAYVPPAIAKAIIAIQKELKPMIKTAENDAFGSSYVPLEDVTERAHELLSAHGIGVMQPTTTDSFGHAALETILFTESGESFARSTKLALSKVGPQEHGSAITYTRRYALMATLGLTGKGEDDDGNKAAGVFAPVTEEQKDRLRSLMKHLKYPKTTMAAEIFNIKTRDHAYLAIKNFEKTVAMKARDEESKDSAEEVEFGTKRTKIAVSGEAPEKSAAPIPDEPEDPLSPSALTKRIRKLGLRDKAAENKLIHRATGKPLMATLKKKEDFTALDQYIKVIESGVQNLPAEFYPPAKEPRIVNEDVA